MFYISTPRQKTVRGGGNNGREYAALKRVSHNVDEWPLLQEVVKIGKLLTLYLFQIAFCICLKFFIYLSKIDKCICLKFQNALKQVSHNVDEWQARGRKDRQAVNIVDYRLHLHDNHMQSGSLFTTFYQKFQISQHEKSMWISVGCCQCTVNHRSATAINYKTLDKAHRTLNDFSTESPRHLIPS